MAGKYKQIIDAIGVASKKISVVYSMRPCIYYYVPPCPECGSYMTGRYVRKPLSKQDMYYIQDQSLKHGELIRIVESVPIANAYCEDCGAEWPEHIYASIFPAWRVDEERAKRKTSRKYSVFQETNPKKRPFWKMFTGFFT